MAMQLSANTKIEATFPKASKTLIVLGASLFPALPLLVYAKL
jgi:hypothetical protein